MIQQERDDIGEGVGGEERDRRRGEGGLEEGGGRRG